MATTKPNHDDEARTTLSLALSVGDKKTLKLMAMERGVTVAALIHEWIQEHKKEDDE